MFGHEQIVKIIDADRGAARSKAGLRHEGAAAAPARPTRSTTICKQKYDDEFRERKQTAGKQARADAIKRAARTQSSPSTCPTDGEREVHAGAGRSRRSTPSKSASSAT